MPTPTKGPRLGGSPAHERLMLANLATSLFKHGRITTTETKAKRLRPLAERLVTFAKKDDLAARRRVRRVIREKDTFVELFETIAPRYTNRPGGYTRIVKIGPRRGDAAPMAIIELVEELEVVATNTKTAKRQAAREDAVAALAGETAEETKAPAAARAADTDADAKVTDEETAAEVEAIEAEAGETEKK